MNQQQTEMFLLDRIRGTITCSLPFSVLEVSYHIMFVVIKQSVNNKEECLWDSVDFHTLVVKTVERSDHEDVAAPPPGW